MNKKIVLQDLNSGEEYPIRLPCLVGREKGVDLSLSDPSISHKHALITEKEGRIWVEDLGSTNGVFVNGWKIGENTALNAGDSLQLGQVAFIVSEAEDDISQQTLILHTIGPQIEAEVDHQRLAVIYEISAELSDSQDIKVLGEKIFSRLKEIFKHDRGYIALFDSEGALRPLLVDPPSESIPLSRTIVNSVFENGESFLLKDALGDSSLSVQESVIALRIRSALCVPLIYHSQIYGLMYLDRNIQSAYSPGDLEFLKSIASMIAPLIENARLWTELKKHYDNAVETLKKTKARLIETERTAAYVRLAQAMAHELRNPLMIMGGMVRRMARMAPENQMGDSCDALMSSVQRIEMVLKEVDDFVKIPYPQLRLQRIDQLIQEGIKGFEQELQGKSICPLLSVNTPHVMIPVDPNLLRKALSMVFREILLTIPNGSTLPITVSEMENELEIVFGEKDSQEQYCDLYETELLSKPWSTSLFLSIAHKILSDHGGKLLLDPHAQNAFPLIMRIQRTINIDGT